MDTTTIPCVDDFIHILQEDDQDPIAPLTGHAHTLLPSEASKMSEYAHSVSSSLDRNDIQLGASNISSHSVNCEQDVPTNHCHGRSPSLGMLEEDVMRSLPVEIPRSSSSSSYRTASYAGSTPASSFYGHSSPALSADTSASYGKRRKLKPGGSEIPEEDLRNDFGSLDSSRMVPSARFACPYFKRNAARHQTWRSCAGPGWDTVHRAKEHVYRRHKLPITCGRCNLKFNTDKEMREHSRLPTPCDIVEAVSREGFDNDQERQLKLRKRPAGQTDVERWIEMYRILFPEDPNSTIPTPYYDTAESRDYQYLCDYKDHLVDILQEKISDLLNVSEIQFVDNAAKAYFYSNLTDVISREAEALFRSYSNPSEKPVLIAQSTTPKASHMNNLLGKSQHSHERILAPVSRRPSTALPMPYGEAIPQHGFFPTHENQPTSSSLSLRPSTLSILPSNKIDNNRRLSDVAISSPTQKSPTLSKPHQNKIVENSGLDLSWDQIMRDVETMGPRLSKRAELTSHSDHE